MKALPVFLALLVLFSAGLPASAAGAAHQNGIYSSALSGAPDTPQGPGAESADGSFTIDLSIAGDCLLASLMGRAPAGSFNAYAAAKPPAYFLEKVYDIFSADDFTIVNLENVLTDRPLKEIEKSTDPAYWYKGPASNVNILSAGSVEAVSLANNHSGDYGPQGRKDTIAALHGACIPYGWNDTTFFLEKNGFRIAVICHGLWNEGQASQITARLKKAEEISDYQIVFFHGGTERIHAPEEWKVRACRKLVDAGADLVVGSHTHCLQPLEVYKGVDIVYSLGNFCYGANRNPENRTVIYKKVLTVNEGNVEAQSSDFIPCYVFTGAANNWQPAPLTDETAKQRVLDFMHWKAPLPYFPKTA